MKKISILIIAILIYLVSVTAASAAMSYSECIVAISDDAIYSNERYYIIWPPNADYVYDESASTTAIGGSALTLCASFTWTSSSKVKNCNPDDSTAPFYSGITSLANGSWFVYSNKIYIVCDNYILAGTGTTVRCYYADLTAGSCDDDDSDRVADLFDDCLNTPEGVEVDEGGCPLDTDDDGVVDYEDTCADTPSGETVDSSGCSDDQNIAKSTYYHVAAAITSLDGSCYYYAKLYLSTGEWQEYGDTNAFVEVMDGTVDATIHYYDTYPTTIDGEYAYADGDTLLNLSTNLPLCSDVSENDKDETVTKKANETLSTGTASATTDTDYDLQTKQVDTLNAIAANQQILSDQGTALLNQQIKQYTQDKELNEQLIDKTGLSTTNDVEDILNADVDSSITSEAAEMQAKVDAYTVPTITAEAYDLTEDTDTTDKDEAISDLSDIPLISNSGVTAESGDCSLSVDVEIMEGVSAPVVFNFCDWVDWIDMLGNVIIALAGLRYIFIVFT